MYTPIQVEYSITKTPLLAMNSIYSMLTKSSLRVTSSLATIKSNEPFQQYYHPASQTGLLLSFMYLLVELAPCRRCDDAAELAILSLSALRRSLVLRDFLEGCVITALAGRRLLLETFLANCSCLKCSLSK